MNERQIAFTILYRIEKDASYANLLLDKAIKESSSTVSSAFLTALVYGVIERKITLDYILSQYLTRPIKRLSPEVLTILRMGVYQIKFMDKVPVSAAVNECVKLSKRNHSAYASGLINSVLRRISNSNIIYPDSNDLIYSLSVQYSCPEELVTHFINDYGLECTEGILASSFLIPPTTVHINTTQITKEKFKKEMLTEGIEVEDTVLDDSVMLSKASNLEKLVSYQKGLFHLQDLASTLCVHALDAKPGQLVLDLCAAPGGKTFTAAELMQNKGNIYAFDLYEHRVKRITESANRLQLTCIHAGVADALKLQERFAQKADRVICDVPCSGFGTIRRKPEIRYKELSSIDKLPILQYNILEIAAKYLNKQGILVYSTCTLNKAENEDVCNRFLHEHPDFQLVGDMQTLFPHKDKTDGFFFAKLRRKHD